MLTKEDRIAIVKYARRLCENRNITDEVEYIIIIMQMLENWVIGDCAKYIRNFTENTPNAFLAGMLAQELKKQMIVPGDGL